MAGNDDERDEPRGYHHGNLREALIRAALELIASKGTAGFTFAEAARFAGVSPAAPYRHFRDRDALMASVAVRGRVLRTGTSLKAEYRWQPARTLTQVNAYNASPEEAFLSFYVRQRVWHGRILPKGMDAVVEATNLLEQGYQPVLSPDGQMLFLAQVPRAVQGGLAFNF